jgi:hypothetical protein
VWGGGGRKFICIALDIRLKITLSINKECELLTNIMFSAHLHISITLVQTGRTNRRTLPSKEVRILRSRDRLSVRFPKDQYT